MLHVWKKLTTYFFIFISIASSTFIPMLEGVPCHGLQRPFSQRHLDASATEADYIIVGGGTAGCALARRLSKKYTVILLEGGIKQDRDPLIMDPKFYDSLVFNYTNRFFWALGHTPIDPDTSSLQNSRRWAGVVGELLGGGSSVNAMQDVRGTSLFFETWQAEAGGDLDWGVENATRVYKRMENFNGVAGQFNPLIHGEKGPIDIRQAVANLEAATIFQQAVIAGGYAPAITDFNDPANSIGAFLYLQLFQQPNKQRESSSTAYLQGFIRRVSSHEYLSRNEKLLVVTKAKAQRILFNQQSNIPRARSVLAVVDGIEKKYRARKEVILCAGFLSTVLLQLSGVGEGAYLEKLGIPVVYDNPNVGKHATNHPGFVLAGRGNVPASTQPDPEGLFSGGAFLSDPTRLRSDRAFQLIGIANPGTPGTFTLFSFLLNPISEGFVSLYYSDPNRMPFFDFNTYGTEEDVNSAVALYGIMYDILVRMGLTPVMQAGSTFTPAPLPSDREGVINYAIRGFIGPFQNYHYQSMNQMATSSKTGVVDHNGHVFGVNNLRVADLSIIPISVRGNTAAVAYLIANVIADKILKDPK